MVTQSGPKTFSQLFPDEPVLVDERRQISPHFLGIGKTRKLIDLGDRLLGFYSLGYQVAWFIADRSTLEVTARGVLADVSLAFGGGHFCVDHVGDLVHLIYTCRSRVHVFHRTGRVAGNRFVLDAHERTAITGTGPWLAAPWLSVDANGSIWVSCVGKKNDFIIAHASTADGPGYAFRQACLFKDAPEWHHSCVQVLPCGKGKAVAVGFAGSFPRDTVLVARQVDDELTFGETDTIGPCDVNDQITFHFQAFGDPERNRAVVTYLGPRGRIDHASWNGATWQVEEGIVPFQVICPQNTLLSNGEVGVLCADYEGRMHALSSSAGAWSAPVAVSRAGLVTISPAFARTGYGSGGIISVARSAGVDMPYLAGELALDPQAPAKLHLGNVGGHYPLTFAASSQPTATWENDQLVLRAGVCGGGQDDLHRSGLGWRFCVSDSSGFVSQAWILSGVGGPRTLLFRFQGNGHAPEGRPVQGTVTLSRQSSGAELVARLSSDFIPAPGAPVVATSYTGVSAIPMAVPTGHMVDLVPFEQEPNSQVARDPGLLPQVFRRMV
jgi:hypothetical protein